LWKAVWGGKKVLLLSNTPQLHTCHMRVGGEMRGREVTVLTNWLYSICSQAIMCLP